MKDEIEAQFISTFIRKEKQGRMLELLPNPKKRDKILSTLYHVQGLDDRFSRAIAPSDQTVDTITSILRKLGAPKECHLISSLEALDGKTMDLREALNSIVGKGNGTLVVCIPTRLGYYEGEEVNDRWLLVRS